MENGPAAAAEGYVEWVEVFVSGEKGRGEIHYYLKRKDGSSDLAVIGKEKSLRHMTCRFMLDLAPSSSSIMKLRSRREVIDWLHSFIPDSPIPVSPQTSDESIDGVNPDEFDVEMMKDAQLWKLGNHTKEFLWLGSPWTCKKRRKHYQAFCRNGVKISVNEFVFVLAEEDKRLVAYLDDMYEDAKGNKMVVVRWFHKIDEVGIDLPLGFNDREIFFSLCLQDLSIECIDGLTTVLSPQHYAKFLKEAKHTQLEAFVCHRQYDNEDIKPLDITQVKGYWKQEILRYILSRSSSKASEKPRKRLRLSRDCKVDLQCATVNNTMDTDYVNVPSNIICLDKGRKDSSIDFHQCTTVGSVVEVLSQDSGMRGCWLRAVIIKKHKNKVKLRYHVIKDAENEANCLEEWILASRIAVRDETGLRIYGRTTIRPAPSAHNDSVSRVINVGAIVDVWWHDGWWEGIVIQKESDATLRVYFPGEKREAVFCQSDLRHSQEWIGSTWKGLNERPDLAASILSDVMKQEKTEKPDSLSRDILDGSTTNLDADLAHKEANSLPAVVDLAKDDSLSKLKWKSSRKRKRSVFLVQKTRRKSHEDGQDQDFVIPSAMKIKKERCKFTKVDRDNYKYISDSLFVSSVVPALTSLVMSR